MTYYRNQGKKPLKLPPETEPYRHEGQVFQSPKALLHKCLPWELYCGWVSRPCPQFTFCHLYISAPHMTQDHSESFSLHHVPCLKPASEDIQQGDIVFQRYLFAFQLMRPSIT